MKPLFAASLLLASISLPPSILSSPTPHPPPYRLPGAVSVHPASENEVSTYLFTLGDGSSLKISALGESTIRVQWDFPSPIKSVIEKLLLVGDFHSASRFDLAETVTHFIVASSSVGVWVSKSSPLRVDFYDQRTGKMISQDRHTEYDPFYSPMADPSYKDLRFTGAAPQGFRVRLTRSVPPESGFFGLGDWAGPINRRGHLVQFWPDDAWDWSPEHSPKYTSFPVFYSITPSPPDSPPTVWGMFFNNPSRTAFDMGKSDPASLALSAASGPVDYFFFMSSSASVGEIASQLTRLTGRPALFPKWAYGYHASRYSYTQSELSTLISGFSEHNIPLSAVFLDIGYMNHAPEEGRIDYGGLEHWDIKQFSWGKTFPAPAEIISSLSEHGVATVALVEPLLAPQDPNFTFALDSGYFIKDSSGSPVTTELWLGRGLGWIDFTNPDAVEWWELKLAEFLGKYDLRGVWNDLNEIADQGNIPLDTPLNAWGSYFSLASATCRYLDLKPLLSISSSIASSQALRVARPAERPYVLSRGGYPGIQRWSAGWSGDNQATEEHLGAAVRASTSVGISGWSNYGHDVGGFYGDPSSELLERWFEWSALSPAMRNHYSKWSNPREPFMFAEPVRSRLIRSIRVRYYFLPHLYSLAYAAHDTGWPMSAPVVSVFPSDRRTFDESDNDFMLGDDVLVAPVVTLGEDRREVYFPSSGFEWHCFWTSRSYPAGTKWNLPAPLGRPLIFVRPLSVLALSPSALVENFSSPCRADLVPKEVEVHIWPGSGKNEYVFYDDDGLSPLTAEDPLRSVIKFRLASTDPGLIQVSAKAEGTSPKLVRLVFRGLPHSAYELRVSGKVVPTALSSTHAGVVSLAAQVSLREGENVMTLSTAP